MKTTNIFASLEELAQQNNRKSFAAMADNQIDYLNETKREIDGLIDGVNELKRKHSPIRKWKRYALVGFASASIAFSGLNIASNPGTLEQRAALYACELSYVARNFAAGLIQVPAGLLGYKVEPRWPLPRGVHYYYFVKDGDSVSSIAAKVSGNKEHAKFIWTYNDLEDPPDPNRPLVIPPSIAKNKKHLYHGAIECSLYRVSDEDSVADIAKRLYGSDKEAENIYRYNRKRNPAFQKSLYFGEWVLLPPKGKS